MKFVYVYIITEFFCNDIVRQILKSTNEFILKLKKHNVKCFDKAGLGFFALTMLDLVCFQRKENYVHKYNLVGIF